MIFARVIFISLIYDGIGIAFDIVKVLYTLLKIKFDISTLSIDNEETVAVYRFWVGY